MTLPSTMTPVVFLTEASELESWGNAVGLEFAHALKLTSIPSQSEKSNHFLIQNIPTYLASIKK